MFAERLSALIVFAKQPSAFVKLPFATLLAVAVLFAFVVVIAVESSARLPVLQVSPAAVLLAVASLAFLSAVAVASLGIVLAFARSVFAIAAAVPPAIAAVFLSAVVFAVSAISLAISFELATLASSVL